MTTSGTGFSTRGFQILSNFDTIQSKPAWSCRNFYSNHFANQLRANHGDGVIAKKCQYARSTRRGQFFFTHPLKTKFSTIQLFDFLSEKVFATAKEIHEMVASKQDEIREVLRNLAYTHFLVVEQMESMICVLSKLLEAGELSLSVKEGRREEGWPVSNRDTLSVEWDGKSCFLGNTLLFRFFERLARTPNRYVSHQDLLDDVWGGDRHPTTIRGVAKRLRDKLSEVGLNDLAMRIDGSENGYYGLIMV